MIQRISLLLILTSSLVSFGQSNKTFTLTLGESAKQVPSYIERPSDAANIFTIWPGNGIPINSTAWTWHEQTSQSSGGKMVRNVVIPTVTMFKPKEGTANGTALIVAPGGAFHFLMMENEGYEVARWLTNFGVTAFVLKYRVKHTPENDADLSLFLKRLGGDLPQVDQYEIYPPMSHQGAEEARLWGEEDGRQAVRFLRQNAKELGVNPNRIGIMGFSAGGGISINTALQHDSLSRPNFVGGIYAGYRIISPLPKDLPPLFMAITDDDKYVAPISSARLYEDWHKKGISVELHIFANGKHGFGIKKQNMLSDSWTELFKNWMISQGFIDVGKNN